MRRHRKISMMSAAALAAVLLVAVAAVAGAAPARSAGQPSDSPVAEELRELERARLAALRDADRRYRVELPTKLLASKIVLTPRPRASGVVTAQLDVTMIRGDYSEPVDAANVAAPPSARSSALQFGTDTGRAPTSSEWPAVTEQIIEAITS